MNRRLSTVLPAVLLVLAACAPVARGGAGAGGPASRAETPAAPVPTGHGTLRQDAFTIALRSGALLIKVTPLGEEVIRLAAPDTYARLHALAESRRRDAARASGVEAPSLFLISFFSYEPDTRFRPDDLQLTHQGRLLRAAAILPLTPGWGAQQLRQQETQSAVYVFDPAIDPNLPLVVRYGAARSDEWIEIVPRLELERAKVRARAGSGSDSSGSDSSGSDS